MRASITPAVITAQSCEHGTAVVLTYVQSSSARRQDATMITLAARNRSFWIGAN